MRLRSAIADLRRRPGIHTPGGGYGFRARARARPGMTALISPDRLQPRFDLRAARFQERRQRQFFAERFHRLVGGETGAVGGDLEQYAVRLAEIQAAKIKPVDLAGVADAELVQPLRPRL